jgi:glycine dehydrogenase
MEFIQRHIGPSSDDVQHMLRTLGYPDLDSFLAAVVPQSIAWRDGLDLPEALSEAEVLEQLHMRAGLNTTRTCMIGLGYSGTLTPGVIRRNVLENPAWYTAYTPYQPEISQGRLEALLNFQTLIEDLTGLPVAGASLLDEPTAVAEAMAIALRTSASNRIIVDADLHPQIHAVLATRAEPIGAELDIVDLAAQPLTGTAAAVITGYPGSSGALRRPRIAEAHDLGAMAIVVADPLALTLVTPPGELGADIVVGSAQRFGVPFGFGGPHAGFMAVRAGLERNLPGRLVGVSVDADGTAAYRLALQTREQHIRREKATSNICTAQVLLAVIASMYVSYHGPDGLRAIAQRVHARAARLASGLRSIGIESTEEHFFDTVRWRVTGQGPEVVAAASEAGIDIRLVDADTVSASTDERTSVADIDALIHAVASVVGRTPDLTEAADALPTSLLRTSPFLTHPVFNEHHSETAMLRYLRRLADRDVALDRSMIPLGSCTMKLNATTEMEPITWAGFADIHPFAPLENARGYLQMIDELESYLCEVTGYDAVSLQPNAGSQGEFAGLLAIRGYHRSRGEQHRDICLIPSSAHGTNAASAVMAGMRVVVVRCDEFGNVDMADVRAKVDEHAADLAAVMVTYPSTHGVFESEITDLCALVHEAGGQVYVDGANLNALIGLAKPGKFGADVSHLNLHKTFCIPHGGGGPGVGPIGVREHLAPFLPGHPMTNPDSPVGPVSGAPWGSAGILPIPWAYIRLMGPRGLADATAVAILSANYVAHQLKDAFATLYVGQNGRVAHECILDVRPITAQTGISVDDIAKRLMDYGFHAPTMSFPVAGTLMVEPTESENLAEIDRFINAMLSIRAEIDAVARGEWPADDNPLVNAPHTAACLIGEWEHPYPAGLAAYPMPGMAQDKVWPNVRRIDGAYGDRNLVCACPRPEELAVG